MVPTVSCAPHCTGDTESKSRHPARPCEEGGGEEAEEEQGQEQLARAPWPRAEGQLLPA